MPLTLIDVLKSEIDKVNKLIKRYDEVPDNLCAFRSCLLKSYIEETEEAIKKDDILQMLQCYLNLKHYTR